MCEICLQAAEKVLKTDYPQLELGEWAVLKLLYQRCEKKEEEKGKHKNNVA